MEHYHTRYSVSIIFPLSFHRFLHVFFMSFPKNANNTKVQKKSRFFFIIATFLYKFLRDEKIFSKNALEIEINNLNFSFAK